MATCERCGREVKNTLIIRKKVSVGLVASVFNVEIEDFNLCPRCAESFKRWLYMRKINFD